MATQPVGHPAAIKYLPELELLVCLNCAQRQDVPRRAQGHPERMLELKQQFAQQHRTCGH